jgi:hypothetical protein
MGVSMHFVMSSAPALHDELQCIHNLTQPPGFLAGDGLCGGYSNKLDRSITSGLATIYSLSSGSRRLASKRPTAHFCE